nr:aminopeptidase P family protein [Ipomoea batatas]
MQLGVPLSFSTPYTTGIIGLSDATALPASLGIARDTTPVSASVGVQPPSPAVVLEAPSRTPVEASRFGSDVELRPITHPTAQGSSTTAESGNAGLQVGSAGPDVSPPDAFLEQSYGGQDAGMAETDTVATLVESPDSSHGGSTQAASSQVVALPLRRSQRSRRLNPKYFGPRQSSFFAGLDGLPDVRPVFLVLLPDVELVFVSPRIKAPMIHRKCHDKRSLLVSSNGKLRFRATWLQRSAGAKHLKGDEDHSPLGSSFTVMGSGPVRSANVDSAGSSRVIDNGDLVQISYCTPPLLGQDIYFDMPVVVRSAKLPPDVQTIMDVARATLTTVWAMVRPGLTAGEVHTAAADVIKYYCAGFWIMAGDPTIPKENDVIDIKPGVYKYGVRGARYGDTARVVTSGHETLTSFELGRDT